MYELAKTYPKAGIAGTAADVVQKYWRLLTLHGQFLESNINESYDLMRRTIVCLFIAIPFLAAGLVTLTAGVGAYLISDAVVVPSSLYYLLYGVASALLLAATFLLLYVRENLHNIGESVKNTLGDLSKDFEAMNDLI